MSSSSPPDRGAQQVGYLGPEGTFSEQALLASAALDAVEPVGLASIYDVVAALRDGRVRWAIVPIENSLDGSITVTLDLLAERSDEVQIVAETLLAVRHALIAAQALSLREIETVFSHPHVPGQCTRFLRTKLAHAQVLPASSTAEAVRMVTASSTAEGPRRGLAALGTSLAAELYGATVICGDVQDRDDNETRFVWLARAAEADSEPPLAEADAGEPKTSLLFWGSGADRAGWLVRCLDEFACREINLTKIESRPRRARLGSYMFFADLAGRVGDAQVDGAIAGLRARCEQVRVLGCYRTARLPRPSTS